MSLKIRVKYPVKFRIFETYFACIKFREFDHTGCFVCIYFREFGQNPQNSRKFVLAKISTIKVFSSSFK